MTKYLLPESWIKVSNFKPIFLSSAEKKRLRLRKRLLMCPTIYGIYSGRKPYQAYFLSKFAKTHNTKDTKNSYQTQKLI